MNYYVFWIYIESSSSPSSWRLLRKRKQIHSGISITSWVVVRCKHTMRLGGIRNSKPYCDRP